MKLQKEILQKIKQIEIHTRRLLRGSMVGDHSSAKKGSGLEFDQLREYQEGDDIRFIDWKASARGDKFLIKQYIEERDRTVMLLVDSSASTFFGSQKSLKSNVISEVASVLALVADCGKDAVGAFLYSDEVKTVVPPRRGRKHAHTVMEKIFTEKLSGKTSLKAALERLIGSHKQESIVFIISDFLDSGYEKILKVASRKHDIVAIRCTDPKEIKLGMKGFLTIKDPETGEESELDLGSKRVGHFLKEHHVETAGTLKRCGVDLLEVATNRPFVGDIIRFFCSRMRY